MFRRHPLHQILGPRLGALADEVGKYLLRAVDEELILGDVRLIKRLCQSERLRLVLHLVGGIPVRHPGILRIEHDVAASLVEKLPDKLPGRVIKHRALAPFLDAECELANDTGLAAARVADGQDVVVLCPGRYAQEVGNILGLDADPVALDGSVELLGADEVWTFQTAAVAQLLAALNILG